MRISLDRLPLCTHCRGNGIPFTLTEYQEDDTGAWVEVEVRATHYCRCDAGRSLQAEHDEQAAHFEGAHR